MADRSAIEWTDATFNPWIGCTKVSPGCDHCYAEQQDKFRSWTPEGWGAGKPRKRTSAANWRGPLAWNARPFCECPVCGNRGEPEFRSGMLPNDERMAMCPKCWHGPMRPARRRVFCSSLADVFDNEVPPEWRADLFELIRQTPNLDWLVLTKRIGNVPDMLDEALRIVNAHQRGEQLFEWLLSWKYRVAPANVWLGATIVNQAEADRDIPKLLRAPARLRFLSMEPLLSAVNLGKHLFACCGKPDVGAEYMGQREELCCGQREPRDLLDWVIVGGESGPGARPMHPDWARSLRNQCAAAGVPFLFKQWGEWAPAEIEPGGRFGDEMRSGRVQLLHAPGNPEGFFRRGDAFVRRVGKKAAGRLLDGLTHEKFPEVRNA